jgi:hypothetical protein
MSKRDADLQKSFSGRPLLLLIPASLKLSLKLANCSVIRTTFLSVSAPLTRHLLDFPQSNGEL